MFQTPLGACNATLFCLFRTEAVITGSHEDEVKELLAQLKDTLSHAPPTQPDGEGVEDEDSVEISSDDEQVRALVERAALGEFDEVPDEPEEESDAPSPPPVSLDDQLKQQWHRDWEEQEERQGQAHLSSELSCELGKNEALRASIAEQQSTIQPNPQPLTSDLVCFFTLLSVNFVAICSSTGL